MGTPSRSQSAVSGIRSCQNHQPLPLKQGPQGNDSCHQRALGNRRHYEAHPQRWVMAGPWMPCLHVPAITALVLQVLRAGVLGRGKFSAPRGPGIVNRDVPSHGLPSGSYRPLRLLTAAPHCPPAVHHPSLTRSFLPELRKFSQILHNEAPPSPGIIHGLMSFSQSTGRNAFGRLDTLAEPWPRHAWLTGF